MPLKYDLMPSEFETNDIDITVIDARSGYRLIDWRELRQYRDLFFFLVWRDIKARYAQSVLGIGWAIIQPVFSMIVFTIVFGRLAKINSDGVPYAIFSYTALVPWTFFSNALSGATSSLISAARMFTKVYFPRLAIPLAPVVGKLVDFGISFLVLLGMMAWYGYLPNRGALLLPFLIFLMVLTASGTGLWLTALAIQYRDINYAMNFFIQVLMYASPVVYPVSDVPETMRLLYALNPMVGVIEGFRSGFLGTVPIPWDLLGVGTVMALLIALSGLIYFRRMERIFADVA